MGRKHNRGETIQIPFEIYFIFDDSLFRVPAQRRQLYQKLKGGTDDAHYRVPVTGTPNDNWLRLKQQVINTCIVTYMILGIGF